MSKSLKTRIKVDHFNSIIHRSYKRLDKYETKALFIGFIDITLTVIIISHLC